MGVVFAQKRINPLVSPTRPEGQSLGECTRVRVCKGKAPFVFSGLVAERRVCFPTGGGERGGEMFRYVLGSGQQRWCGE